MWRLTLGEPDDQRIRRTIAAYLGQGPTATELSTIAMTEGVNVKSALARINRCQPGDPFEWAGAAARQLETYPGHPILLAVRAAGEAQLPDGTSLAFGEFVTELLGNLDDYDIRQRDADRLFEWLRHALLNFNAGARASWVTHLWALWLSHRGTSAGLDRMSHEALADADSDPSDLDSARAYRLARLGAALEPPPPLSPGERHD
jgi:hypothetical protein